MSSKPLVPSKDALRVLRSLAYSPPAAFLGVAGALCGVATVHYHERRKVRQAERILETKRKLHTITQGRGSARLASMFEAAEKGEDFTINKGGKPRDPRKRAYSSLVTPRESDDPADWKSKGQLHEDRLGAPGLDHELSNPLPTHVPENAKHLPPEAVDQVSAESEVWMPFVQVKGADSEVEQETAAEFEVEKETAAEPEVEQEAAGKSGLWMPFVGDNYVRHSNNSNASGTEHRTRNLPTGYVLKENADREFREDIDNSSRVKKFWHDATAWSSSRDRNRNYTWRDLRTKTSNVASEMPKKVLEILEQQDQFQSTNFTTEEYFGQQETDLNPAYGDDLEDISSTFRPAQAVNVDKNNSILMESNPASNFKNSPFSLLQPWQSSSKGETVFSDSADLAVDHSVKDTSTQPTAISQPDLYLDLSAAIPPFRNKHHFKSRYDLRHPFVIRAMDYVGADRYEWVFSSLMDCRLEHGVELAISWLEQTMDQYTSTNKAFDFALVQALFLDFTRVFDAHSIKSLVWRYVEKHLAGDVPRLEVVSLLYPLCGAGEHHSKDQSYYFPANQYLQTIQRKGYSLDQQVIELRKVLAGTHLYNIEPHEHLMMPILKAYCNAGNMVSAQALFDEMLSVHKVKVTSYSIRVLVKGYAQAGNWSKLKSILSNYQDYGQSGQVTYGIAGHLVAIVKEYSQRKSPEEVVNFVEHAVRVFQIQPVGGLTREVVSVCLRHRRYDLVVSWIEMMQIDYPHVDAGTSSSTFAYEVASVWKDTNASVEDILNGCRALAINSLRDPFSKTFRSSISEAVSRYLRTQLDELRREIQSGVPHFDPSNIDALQDSMERLNDTTAIQMYGTRARLLLPQILKEIHALRRLDALCGGHNPPLRTAPRSTNIQQPHRAIETYRTPNPPDLVELQEMLITEYERGNKAGQVTRHDSLEETVRLLVEHGRIADAFDLVQFVYDSRWAQPPFGQEFNPEIFIQWLELARQLRSGSRLRTVLWALVDASPQIQLTSQIVLLARIAAPKVSVSNVKRATLQEVYEVEYLRTRLRQRLWSTGQGNLLMMSAWKGFGKPHPRLRDRDEFSRSAHH